MNYLLIIFFTIHSALALQVAEFSFKETTLKLPKTPEGEIIRFQYEFENTGKAPLIITEIKVQCPCTQTEFPKDPVPPGGKGIIKVTFDSKNKIGYQDRTLEIYSNASKSPFTLRFKVLIDNKK